MPYSLVTSLQQRTEQGELGESITGEIGCGTRNRTLRYLVAGDRFELPMLLAYETGVVTTLPAIEFSNDSISLRY